MRKAEENLTKVANPVLDGLCRLSASVFFGGLFGSKLDSRYPRSIVPIVAKTCSKAVLQLRLRH